MTTVSKKSLIASVVVAAMLVAASVTSSAASPIVNEMLEGTEVATVPSGGEAILAPSAVPSDTGKLLVSWYGGENNQWCSDANADGTVPPFCSTRARVLNADGTFASAEIDLGGPSAPYYYGTPDASWNPVDKEWVAHWTSYSDEPDVPSAPFEFGLFLRRVSEDGQLLGSVVGVPNTGFDGVDSWRYLRNAVNQELIWLPQTSEWLLVSYFQGTKTTEDTMQGLLGYLKFSADLSQVDTQWTIFASGNGYRPQGVSAALAGDGSIGLTYFQEESLYFQRIVFGANPEVSSRTVLANNSQAAAYGAGLTYSSTIDRFVVTYTSKSAVELRAVTVTVSDLPVLSDISLFDYSTINSGSFTYGQLRRNYVVADDELGHLYVAQHAWTSVGSAAVLLKLNLSDFSLVSVTPVGQEINRTDEFSEHFRSPGRPVLRETVNSIALAYVSWDGSFFAEDRPKYVVATFIRNAGQSEPEPIDYNGPIVSNAPAKSSSGSTVSYRGSGFDRVISATIGGKPAAIVSKAASQVVLRVPTGLNEGRHDVVMTYGSGSTVIVQQGFELDDNAVAWTKRSTDNTIKMYAKNVVNAGKVQFFQNGREVAWINAATVTNPKLAFANNSHYLVRTRELVAGKNVFEVYVDGVRIWRAAYSR